MPTADLLDRSTCPLPTPAPPPAPTADLCAGASTADRFAGASTAASTADRFAGDPSTGDLPVPDAPANDMGAGTALPCWSADPDLWFAESPADVESAKALCVPCSLRDACLAGALQRREPWGVWGGQLVLAGVVVPRKRPRGRPRKDASA